VKLILPLPPRGFQRPRPKAGGKGYYSPHDAALQETRMLLRQARKHAREAILDGPVAVSMGIGAQSTSIEVTAVVGAEPGRPKGVRADLDNIIKFLADACQEAVYVDDRQVVALDAWFVSDYTDNR